MSCIRADRPFATNIVIAAFAGARGYVHARPPMRRLVGRLVLRLSVLALCCVGLTACAAEDARSKRGTSAGDMSGAAGSSSSIDFPANGAGSSGGGGSGSGSVVPDGGVGSTSEPLPTPIAIDECGASNPGGLSAADVTALQAGGSPGELGYMYPYDGTVFPRGLIAPLLMWSGADTATGVYVHMKSSLFEYNGCLKPTGPGQLEVPQSVWEAAGAHTLGATDPFNVELTVLDGGAVKGPVREQIIIARATLKGSIYYNSYESKLSMNPGAVLRIVPGKTAELFSGGDHCAGCHAVSADGTRLIAQHGETGDIIALTPTTAPMPTPLRADGANTAFVGLSPDGKVYATNAKPDGFGPRSGGGTDPLGMLYETDTGNAITGSGLPQTAIMTTFSPDAKHLVFNDYALDKGHGIALMDYDPKARKASNQRTVTMTTDKVPGWPFLLPDNNAVVFALGTASDFAGGNVGIKPIAGVPPGPWNTFISPDKGPYSNLFIVSATGGEPVMLARAMGYANAQDAAAGKSSLKFGAEEQDQNYYPTVSPVAAGGYFWVFFDSYRHYGNLGLHRQLWGTAISVSATGEYTTDPSHPAFYLTGQEQGTGNHRAFAALDACRADSAACTTGIDCCGGFCTDGVCAQPDRCANTDEACDTAADCCDRSNSCIGGFCGEVTPE